MAPPVRLEATEESTLAVTPPRADRPRRPAGGSATGGLATSGGISGSVFRVSDGCAAAAAGSAAAATKESSTDTTAGGGSGGAWSPVPSPIIPACKANESGKDQRAASVRVARTGAASTARGWVAISRCSCMERTFGRIRCGATDARPGNLTVMPAMTARPAPGSAPTVPRLLLARKPASSPLAGGREQHRSNRVSTPPSTRMLPQPYPVHGSTRA